MPIEIDILPVAKPRMTRLDKWKKRPIVMRYRAFCDELRLKLKYLPDEFEVTFVMPMPKSWSKKKRDAMNGKPHQINEDLDNLLKSLNDAIRDDDSSIHHINARKIWGWSGKIILDWK